MSSRLSVRAWEQSARLTSAEFAGIQELQALVAERPIGVADKSCGAGVGDADAAEALLAGERIEHAQQFFEWFSLIQGELVDEQEEKCNQFVRQVGAYREDCRRLVEELDVALESLDELGRHHTHVTESTEQLHNACERIVDERRELTEMVASMKVRLGYFNDMEAISRLLMSEHVDASSPEFAAKMRRLDECLAYMGANPHFREASSYMLRFRSLQNRGLSIIRQHIVAVLGNACDAITSAAGERAGAGGGDAAASASEAGTGANGDAEDKTEGDGEESGGEVEQPLATRIYVGFRAAAPAVRPIIADLEAHAHRKEYSSLLESCHQHYFEFRLGLLGPVVDARLTEMLGEVEASAGRGDLDPEVLLSGIRRACLYMLGVCHKEWTLYARFFTVSDPTAERTEGGVLTAAGAAQNEAWLAGGGGVSPDFFAGICEDLYFRLRPLFIHQTDIDVLTDLCSILKTEIVEGHIDSSSDPSYASFRPTAVRMLSDVQERLFFRAQMYVRHAIADYAPTEEDMARIMGASAGDGGAAGGVAGDVGGAGTASASGDGARRALRNLRRPYESWYPALTRTLMLMSKLYRSLDLAIFEGIAQDAVLECTQALVVASNTVGERVSPVHGHLFLIGNLLTLRSQLSTFRISFTKTEKHLDWSQALSNLVSSFSFSFERLLGIMTGAAPTVVQSSIDAKQHLDSKLKGACDAFITLMQRKTLGPLITLMRTVNEYSAAHGGKLTEAIAGEPFAQAEAVRGVLDEVDEAFEDTLVDLAGLLHAYLAPDTHPVLLQPIRKAAIDLYNELHKLDVCYTDDQLAQIAAPAPMEVAASFDRILGQGDVALQPRADVTNDVIESVSDHAPADDPAPADHAPADHTGE